MRKRKFHFAYLYIIAILLSLIPASPLWGYEKEINTLSAAMAEKISKAGRTSVAVVDFSDLEGNVTQLGRFIAEEFSIALTRAGKGFKVVDRTHLNSIVKENKISATGLIDPETARKLGKIIGVQALITGTLTPFGENVRVSVKVLDTATAEVVDATRGNIAKTQGIKELLGKGIAVAHVRSTTSTTKKKGTVAKQSQDSTSGPFSDDFNMGPKPDWRPFAGDWTMVNGTYTVINDIKSKTVYGTFLENKKWKNFFISLDVMPSITYYRINICPRMISLSERVCFGMSGDQNEFNKIYWFTVNDGKGSEYIGKASIKTPKAESSRIRIEVKNNIFTAYINDVKVSDIYNASFAEGSVGLFKYYDNWWDKGTRIAFDNIEISPLSD